MSLDDHVKDLSGRDLPLPPAQQFVYSNANYNLFGYMIEQVSGHPYSSFMESEIFAPLGLTSTFASGVLDDLISGTRLSFFRAWQYDSSVSEGNVPAGFIISSAKDMSRWLQIQLGFVDVPPAYAAAIEKSHQPSPSSHADENTYYAAFWFVETDSGRIYHSGGTPNYSSASS